MKLKDNVSTDKYPECMGIRGPYMRTGSRDFETGERYVKITEVGTLRNVNFLGFWVHEDDLEWNNED